jgi:hypothetical protein
MGGGGEALASVAVRSSGRRAEVADTRRTASMALWDLTRYTTSNWTFASMCSHAQIYGSLMELIINRQIGSGLHGKSAATRNEGVRYAQRP